jgi:hypothetical protein
MAWMGRGLALVVLTFALGACKKNEGAATGPASGGGSQAASPGAAGGGGPGGGEEGATGGGGPMGPAEFCKTFGDKAKQEGGKAADFWERNYGKDCVKRMTAEKKKKGDDKWNAFVSCANGEATAADAFDTCEL